MSYYPLPTRQGREQIKNGIYLLTNDLSNFRKSLIDNWDNLKQVVYPSYILGLTSPQIIELNVFNGGVTNNIVVDTLSVAFPASILVYEFFKSNALFEKPENKLERKLKRIESFFRKYF